MGSIHDITIQLKNQRLKLFDLKKRKHVKTDVRSAGMLELFFWLCLHQIDIRSGGIYDKRALELRHDSLNSDIGVGLSERSIRHMLGISTDVKGSSSSIDIFETGFEGEVKEIQGKTGKFTDIKMNRNGRNVWNECRKELQEHQAYGSLLEDQKRRIEVGELSNLKAFLDELKEVFKRHLRPSNAMQHEPRLYCGGHECFLTIQSCDYDVAWIKPRITMGGCIKYSLSRRYLVREILKILKREDFQSIEHEKISTIIGSMNNIKKFFQHAYGVRSLTDSIIVFK